MSTRYLSQYIDDKAAVDHDTEGKSEDGSDDEDSYEAQLRQQDQHDFHMADIEAGHEERLRASGPYRIPPHLLESGVATPSRGNTPDPDSRVTAGLELPPIPPPPSDLTPFQREFTPMRVHQVTLPSVTELISYTPPRFPSHDSAPQSPSHDSAQQSPSHNSAPRSPSRDPTPRSPSQECTSRSQSPDSAPRKRPASVTSEPPAKRARISKSQMQKYLDIQAEDSDEDNSADEEGDDDGTLSDQEFLNDEPEPASEYRPLRLHDADDDSDRRLAAYYDQLGRTYARESEEEAGRVFAVKGPTPDITVARPAPHAQDTTLRIHTWVSPKRGLHKGRVAFVLSKLKLLVHIEQRLSFGLTDAHCLEIHSSLPMHAKDYNVLDPSPKLLEPFLDEKQLASLPFTGNCPALAEGDRVVVVQGEHKGKTGYITILREVPYAQQRVRCAKIEESYDGVAKVARKKSGIYIELHHLRRHLLDLHIPIRINDRIRVVDGLFFCGVSGRVQQIDGEIFTIVVANNTDIVGPTTRSELSTGYVFQVDLQYIQREFLPGDVVRVQRGRYEGRGGIIVKVMTGGGVEIFESGSEESLRVRSADVEWDVRFNQIMESRGMYSQPSTLSVAHVLSNQDEDNLSKLMHTGRRFLGMEVHVVGRSVNKGLRGVVVGDHDSDVRAKRLGRQRGHRLDFSGIIVTIQKEMTNVNYDVPIEKVHHLHTTLTLAQAVLLPKDILKTYEQALLEARVETSQDVCRRTPSPDFGCATGRAGTADVERRTPPPESAMDVYWGLPTFAPILPGEETGQWICIEELAGKRFDVQLLGTRNLRGKTSDTVRKLDGTFGHLLPAGPILSTNKKVDVYGLGKTRTKHAIDITCVRPRRTDDNGRGLTEITTRVVIVGPDAGMSSNEFRGRYGLTVPDMVHRHGENMVGVKFARRGEEEHQTGVFHISSLCIAKNERIETLHGTFDITDFD